MRSKLLEDQTNNVQRELKLSKKNEQIVISQVDAGCMHNPDNKHGWVDKIS